MPTYYKPARRLRRRNVVGEMHRAKSGRFSRSKRSTLVGLFSNPRRRRRNFPGYARGHKQGCTCGFCAAVRKAKGRKATTSRSKPKSKKKSTKRTTTKRRKHRTLRGRRVAVPSYVKFRRPGKPAKAVVVAAPAGPVYKTVTRHGKKIKVLIPGKQPVVAVVAAPVSGYRAMSEAPEIRANPRRRRKNAKRKHRKGARRHNAFRRRRRNPGYGRPLYGRSKRRYVFLKRNPRRRRRNAFRRRSFFRRNPLGFLTVKKVGGVLAGVGLSFGLPLLVTRFTGWRAPSSDWGLVASSGILAVAPTQILPRLPFFGKYFTRLRISPLAKFMMYGGLFATAVLAASRYSAKVRSYVLPIENMLLGLPSGSVAAAGPQLTVAGQTFMQALTASGVPAAQALQIVAATPGMKDYYSPRMRDYYTPRKIGMTDYIKPGSLGKTASYFVKTEKF